MGAKAILIIYGRTMSTTSRASRQPSTALSSNRVIAVDIPALPQCE